MWVKQALACGYRYQ